MVCELFLSLLPPTDFHIYLAVPQINQIGEKMQIKFIKGQEIHSSSSFCYKTNVMKLKDELKI